MESSPTGMVGATCHGQVVKEGDLQGTLRASEVDKDRKKSWARGSI